MRSPSIIRVAVADDEPVILHALVRCLRTQPDLEVIAEAKDASELLAKTDRRDIDVVLCDRRMPGDVPAAIRGIRSRAAAPAVIVLTGYDDPPCECIDAGAASHLTKQCTAWDILNAIRDQARWRWKLLETDRPATKVAGSQRPRTT